MPVTVNVMWQRGRARRHVPCASRSTVWKNWHEKDVDVWWHSSCAVTCGRARTADLIPECWTVGSGKTGSGTEWRISMRNRQRVILPDVLPHPQRLSLVFWEEPECPVLIGWFLLKANPNEMQCEKSVLFFLQSSGTCISEKLDTGLNFLWGWNRWEKKLPQFTNPNKCRSPIQREAQTTHWELRWANFYSPTSAQALFPRKSSGDLMSFSLR